MTWFGVWDPVWVGLVGLLFGSFLNVVIYRLPKMMEAQWDRDCAEHLGQTPATQAPTFNLMVPRSRCQACGHTLSWYENIPVLSYVALRGRCKACKTAISPRYPLIEIATAGLFALCAQRWGISFSTLAWCGFAATLLALAMIDWDTTLLPDDLTLPLLWAGLIAAAAGWTQVDLRTALWGAVAGYLSLWLIYWGFKLLTGKEGMGYGDFKLYAALGAWFGWPTLLPIILISSVIGAVIGIALKFSSGLREGGYIPFGPFLAGAGFAAMIWGPDRLQAVLLGWIGG
ncbi:MAG: prepilin peptidase [Curvibacter lanceolatus]|jgi:leader peptidase (prepilin peptidase)/N-methyltransferase|uniref:prepilin peptidase n=1 Tax=Curvibacter lanceolatus TaxID=86182 RepID=UPI0023546416|nr:A24 family peptidase [Curvibacter lanceolatus]MBV5292781.1 prepilin peptidase [Curvibacter lanceolatus]